MIISFLYIILAILGISFLIFIHELGHYWMARRVGMRVETFSIGFGQPIFSWEKDGVKWQVGWLLFGGYVKIAGVELSKDQNPYEISDGFFGKRPIDRIKVALMGPVANLLFALVAFALLWGIGGRMKNFSDHTSIIGWVDPKSELFAKGVRPGDEITAYDSMQFEGARDHLYAPLTGKDRLHIHGYHVDYVSGEKIPFDYDVKLYPHPAAIEKGITTAGILNSASYLLYDRNPSGKENPLPEGSPLIGSGLEYGDRIAWINGEMVFSLPQLNHILNNNRVLVTVQRNSKTFLAQIPRILVQELKPDPAYKEELKDWQFAGGLKNIKLANLYTIPYNMTNDGIIENPLKFIDRENQTEAFPEHPESPLAQLLQKGDKIIAINGTPIQRAYEILQQVQTNQVNVIVQRSDKISEPESWKNEDKEFEQEINAKDLKALANSLGTSHPLTHVGDYYLLKPITPKRQSEFATSAESQALRLNELQEQKKAIDKIEDPELKSQALRLFEKQENRLMLGLPVQDRLVQYNPSPFALFYSVFDEIFRTLSALLSGALSPKWLVGPIGIVQVVHDTSMVSIKEALFWLGAISLNLGILNLLPIPVLDGGTILMSFLEMITRRKLHPKTLEKLIIPFAALLIGLFVYLTYHDLLRIFSGWLS